MSAGAERTRTYRGLVRNPNFLRVFSAGIGSVAGSAITSVCLVWIVYASTGSALDVGLLGAANVAGAILFSVFGGTLVDRSDRRRLLILSYLVRAAAMTVVVVVLEIHGFSLPTLLGAYFLIGAFTTVFNPAEQAIVPALVRAGEVADANGLVRSSRSAVQFAGSAVAGLLIVTIGPTIGLVVNALTFFLSATLLTGLRVASPNRGHAAGPGRPTYFSDVREGFRWLYGARGFFELTLSAMFFNFCANFVFTFLVFYVTELLHGSALLFALLLALEVLGVAIGSLLVGRVGAARYAGKAWTIPYGVGSGLLALLFIAVPTLAIAAPVVFVLGLFSGFAGTAWLTAAQLLVPDEMQGRYFGIDNLGSVAILPVAQIGGAFLIVADGLRTTYVAVALLWIVSGLAFLLPRALMRLGVRAEVTSRTAGAASGTSGSPEGTRGG